MIFLYRLILILLIFLIVLSIVNITLLYNKNDPYGNFYKNNDSYNLNIKCNI